MWLVVVDDQVYVRLGDRAADRVQKSKSAPFVGVTVAGKRFEKVRCEPAPDQAPRVAEAIGKKYTSDLLIRLFSTRSPAGSFPSEAPPGARPVSTGARSRARAGRAPAPPWLPASTPASCSRPLSPFSNVLVVGVLGEGSVAIDGGTQAEEDALALGASRGTLPERSW